MKPSFSDFFKSQSWEQFAAWFFSGAALTVVVLGGVGVCFCGCLLARCLSKKARDRNAMSEDELARLFAGSGTAAAQSSDPVFLALQRQGHLN